MVPDSPMPGAPMLATLVPDIPIPDSQSILEYLQRANLFLVSLDDERSWFRYHHLFVDVLRGMLRSAWPPGQIAGLHARAADWYRQSGFVAEAIHHAVQAGDHERAAGVVEETAWSMVLHAELVTLRKWIEALPGALVSARPWLCIYYAWALFFADSDAAEVQLQGVEQRSRSGDGIALSGEMQGHIAAIRAWIAYMRGESERAVVLSRQALELHPQMDPTVRSGLLIFLATGYLIQNDLPACARAHTEALALAQSSGNIMLEVLSRAALGTLCEIMGRLHEAEAIFQEALQTAIQNRSPVAGQAYACLAHLHLEWNDLASVRRYAEKLIESSGMWGVVDARACGHLHVATVLQAQGDLAGANRAFAEASEVMRRHPLELRSAAWLGATRVKLWLAQGKLDDARHWAEGRGLSAEANFGLGNVTEYLALVRILLAEGRVGAARRLLSRLRRLLEPAGRPGQLIEILVLQAIAWELQANTRSALGELERAVSLARPEGYVRVFLDGGKPIENLLNVANTQWRDRALLAYARKLLSAFAGEGAPSSADQVPPAGILSERELEVLCLMAAGSSNQEIADELVIALGTAKRHTANIFGKLDVRNRTEAVTRARQLGLL
jgi:LuxR family maltose regulon positive regulatory protein